MWACDVLDVNAAAKRDGATKFPVREDGGASSGNVNVELPDFEVDFLSGSVGQVVDAEPGIELPVADRSIRRLEDYHHWNVV